MIRALNPWYENISKRQIKSPKIYFRDSGIFHSLLGASWEVCALEEVIRIGIQSAIFGPWLVVLK